MNIRDIWIDGFGVFREAPLRDIRAGITVFLGNNEAGKSTALAFFRAMLFGFADGRMREAQYQPLRGGQHGGRLTLVTDEGTQLTLERTPGPRGGNLSIVDARGTQVDPLIWERLIGGVTRDVFRTVYGFGLLELQSLETLQTDEINAAIYSGAAGAGLQSLPAARRSLERLRAELYAPRGRNPAVNRDLKALAEIRADLATARADVEEYRRVDDARQRADDALAECAREKAEHAAELASVTRRLDVWPHWFRLLDLEAQLAELPACDPGAVEAVAPDIDALVARRQALTEARDERSERLAALDSELRDLKVDDELLGHEQALANLREDLPHYRDACRRLIQIDTALETTSRAATDGLAEMGSSWSEDQVRTLSAEFLAREEVRAFQRQTLAAEQTLRQTETEVHGLEERLEELNARHDSLPEDALPEGVGEKDIAERLALVRRTRRDLDTEALLSRQRQLLADESRRRARAARRDRLASLSVAATLVLAGLAACLTAQAADRDWSWFLPLGVALAGAGVLVLVAGTVRHSLRSTADDDATGKRLAQDAAALESRLADCSAALGCDVRCEGELDRIETEWLVLRSRLEERPRRDKERARLAENRDRMQQRLSQAVAAHNRARDNLDAALTAWQNWLAEHGLPTRLSPDSATDALARISALGDTLRKRDALAAERAALRNRTAAFEQRVRDLLQKTGRGCPPDGDVVNAADTLQRDVAAAHKAATMREERHRALASERERFKECERQIGRLDAELNEILRRLQVGSVAEFREQAATAAVHRTLSHDSRACIATLKAGLGCDDLQRIRSEFRASDRRTLEETARRLDDELTDVEQRRETARTQLAEYALRLETLAGSDDIARLRQDEESVRETLRQHARQWAVATTAQLLLDEAQRRFEKARKPDVIREAERFFNTMTDGRYTQIRAPLGEERIDVVDRNGRPKAPDELSRGTAEQLYLALRFGYALTHARGAETFPLIMDDVFVNFDPERAAAAVRTVVELAESRQVLYFTCHPEIARVFCDASAEPDLVVLEDGTFRRADPSELRLAHH